MIENIKIGDKDCATIIRANFHADGIQFLTDPSSSLQLGYMNRAAGHVIQPHVHKPVPRSVEYTHEVLFIRSGLVRVNFFDDDHEFRSSTILAQGDVILLTSCGHGFEILEDSEIVEVKQGPFAGADDKTRF